jgi:hypothetical protein
MKNSTITYLLGFFFLITCTKALCARPATDTNLCLEIDGKILNADEGSDGQCTIELIHSNIVIASTVLKDGKKKFKFILKKNTNYMIRISKEGYISRLVSVDTKLDEGDTDFYSFAFETKLLKEVASQRLNKDLLDFPIALIYFDAKKDCFDYNREYTSKIKKDLAMK